MKPDPWRSAMFWILMVISIWGWHNANEQKHRAEGLAAIADSLEYRNQCLETLGDCTEPLTVGGDKIAYGRRWRDWKP